MTSPRPRTTASASRPQQNNSSESSLMANSTGTSTRAWTRTRRILGSVFGLALGLATLAVIVLAGATITGRSTTQAARTSSTSASSSSQHTESASGTDMAQPGRRLVVAFVAGTGGTIASDLL